jgi:hypothetical protein
LRASVTSLAASVWISTGAGWIAIYFTNSVGWPQGGLCGDGIGHIEANSDPPGVDVLLTEQVECCQGCGQPRCGGGLGSSAGVRLAGQLMGPETYGVSTER